MVLAGTTPLEATGFWIISAKTAKRFLGPSRPSGGGGGFNEIASPHLKGLTLDFSKAFAPDGKFWRSYALYKCFQLFDDGIPANFNVLAPHHRHVLT